MRAAAGLHAEQTRRQVDEERRHLVSAQLLLHEHLAVLVDSVDLEHVLRQVDTNSRKLHGGNPFSVQVVDKRLHFGTSMPLWAGAFIPLLTFLASLWALAYLLIFIATSLLTDLFGIGVAGHIGTGGPFNLHRSEAFGG
jgi:VIT1/CCC1 family predicted Fe2+/Mn2+ transporter